MVAVAIANCTGRVVGGTREAHVSLLDDFLANTEIFKGGENRLDQEAFEKLLADQGPEVARGYLKGVYEFAETLSTLLRVGEGQGNRKTPGFVDTQTNAYNKLLNLHKALFGFLQEQGLESDHLRPPYASTYRSRMQGF